MQGETNFEAKLFLERWKRTCILVELLSRNLSDLRLKFQWTVLQLALSLTRLEDAIMSVGEPFPSHWNLVNFDSSFMHPSPVTLLTNWTVLSKTKREPRQPPTSKLEECDEFDIIEINNAADIRHWEQWRSQLNGYDMPTSTKVRSTTEANLTVHPTNR